MTEWQERPVLVTGAGGFIGSHVVGRLAAAGARVRALVRYNSRGELGALRWEPGAAEADIRFADLRDAAAVEAAMAGCEVVIHLGAQIGIPYSYAAPDDVVQTNVFGTLNVLLAARSLEVERLVCISTSEVYGSAQRVPIDEAHPLNAQSPYAASKIAADMLAGSFHRSYACPVGILRLFNGYGPRQSARAVIPTILGQALSGDRIRLGSLDTVRDFTYVDDLVEGILAFAAWPGAPGATLQLGAGRGISIGELVDLAGEILNRPLEVVADSQRFRPGASEVDRLICDPSAARRALGWEPRVPLREGLESTLEWMETNLAFYRPQAYAV